MVLVHVILLDLAGLRKGSLDVLVDGLEPVRRERGGRQDCAGTFPKKLPCNEQKNRFGFTYEYFTPPTHMYSRNTEGHTSFSRSKG